MGVEEAPTSKRAGGDYLTILSGTSQNVVGIVVAGVATIAANILMSHRLGPAGFGIVTVITQLFFVVSFATRAGMDMASLREVAVDVGAGREGRVRSTVAYAAGVAGLVSLVVAVIAVLASGFIRDVLSIDPDAGEWAVQGGAIGLPFLALANVWLSATRGLKIMRYTLYIFWAGQPVAWVILMLSGWSISETPWMSVLAYSASWALASVAAFAAWRKESKRWPKDPMGPGALEKLMRYAGPRAPAALFSQLLFWTDLFVLTRYASEVEVGIYSAALRAGQILVLFLTSVNLMFAPYVADLYAKGEIDRLDKLFKTLTRWTIVATLPAFILLAVTPSSVLRIFGPDFSEGKTALAILLLGQFVNICTGSVGFVLIMVGRTGWDLLVYTGSLICSLTLAFILCPRYGMEGAAIANAVTFGASNIVRLLLVRKFVGIQPYDRAYLRLLGPAVAAALAMLFAHQFVPEGKWALDLLATGLIGGAVYAVTYLLFGMTNDERRGLQMILGRLRRA
jgi:O-antigen/teichoic acid export membrane protein